MKIASQSVGWSMAFECREPPLRPTLRMSLVSLSLQYIIHCNSSKTTKQQCFTDHENHPRGRGNRMQIIEYEDQEQLGKGQAACNYISVRDSRQAICSLPVNGIRACRGANCGSTDSFYASSQNQQRNNTHRMLPGCTNRHLCKSKVWWPMLCEGDFKLGVEEEGCSQVRVVLYQDLQKKQTGHMHRTSILNEIRKFRLIEAHVDQAYKSTISFGPPGGRVQPSLYIMCGGPMHMRICAGNPMQMCKQSYTSPT